ncbi:MAG: hypothetical protein HGA75_08020 [Thiobacillus sp.]|nr:hypothetical protein [Thiobacillus sp.]
MKPSLQQTGPEAGANITLATKAKQAEDWLAALPLGDPPGTARALTEYLLAHDRPEVAASLRKQVYDVLSDGIRRTLNLLAKKLRNQRLPLDERELDHVDRAIDLLGAVAEFNKRFLLEGSERALPLFGSGQSAGYYSAFLHARLETMAVCHLSHRQLPDGFWLGINQVGQKLIQSGLADSADPVRSPATLRDVYLALLLEATADPYHLSELERTWTIDVIARHGALALIEPAKAMSRGGVFGIQAQHDRPPYPLSWQRNATPACDLVLNTGPLVRKLAIILSQMERGRTPEQDVPVVRHPGYKDLLQRLKLTWGGSTQRTSTRHRPAQPGRRTLLVGFDAVHRQLAEPHGASDPAGAASCQLVNDSPGGMALQVAKPAFRLRIGSLVCVCDSQGRRELGLVRWFKTGPDGALSFGIKSRHGKALPLYWLRPGAEQPTPCLLMEPEKGRHAGARHLIVPAQGLGKETRLAVRLGGAELAIEVGARIEATPDVEVYRCEVESG